MVDLDRPFEGVVRPGRLRATVVDHLDGSGINLVAEALVLVKLVDP